MDSLSIPKLILKRLADDWKLLLSIFAGILVASSLVAGAPVYLRSLERLSLNTAIDRAPTTFLDIFVFAPHIPLTGDSLQATEGEMEASIMRNVAPFYEGRERYLKGPTYLVGTDDQPLTTVPGGRERVSRGYFQSITNLEHHVLFLDGRMATDAILEGQRGPIVEAVIGLSASKTFDLQVGEEVVLTPTLFDRNRVTARIVGIIEPIDPTEDYWQHNSSIFLDPQPLEEIPDAGIEVDPQEPPLALFVTRHAMVEGVGAAFPGTLVSSIWFIFVDNEALKKLSVEQMRASVETLDGEIASAMRGSAVFTGIRAMINTFERRSFFSSVPLLLLLTIMVITVLYYLGMMVSYLVQSREGDVALLRSRGVSTAQLLRLYAFEGLVLVVLAVVIAPFLAMGAVALSGKLPYFRELSHGAFLPLEFSWWPFAVAAGVGAISLLVFVVPAVVAARTGLVIHKLRSSRPPSVPVFHRYYIDVLVMVIGGLVFWELQARGQLVAGGLFTGIKVNEALLFAPVLFLTVVALLFMRFFPLFVRFITGESPTLLHLVVGAVLVFLAAVNTARGLQANEGIGWLWPVMLLIMLAVAYWATFRAERPRWQVVGLAAQSALAAGFLLLRPFNPSDAAFLPSVGLTAIVPAQVLFYLFRATTRAAPVWVSMGLWHMARNPLQYVWLVLMLVMVAGLGVLAMTVGGTLDRSHQERILYDVATDIRVMGAPAFFAQGNQALKKRYLTIPGVTSVSLGLRGRGALGPNSAGGSFDILAVESHDFARISWYRDDFSESSLRGLMRSIQPVMRNEPITLPDDATTIGLWAKPQEVYNNMFLWLVLQDSRGIVKTVTLGRTGEPEWHVMRTNLPRAVEPPLQLVSVQIYEPVFGPAGTPGSIRLDRLHVTVGPDAQEVVLEDFEENQLQWLPLATSLLSSDRLTLSRGDVYSGDSSGVFSFGKDTDRGIRGFYHTPTGGPVPIIASSTFMRNTGSSVGDTLIVDLLGRLVPVVVRDAVDYFPTLNPGRGGFVIADLDNLLRHVNVVSPTTQIFPNELFIVEAPRAGEEVRDTVISLVGSSEFVRDKRQMLESVRLDPMITAGWKAMVLLSIAVILFTAGLGYVTYLLAFADRSRAEIGFLQSLGLSARQMIGLLSLEHVVIIVVGLGLGTWAGFQMSTLMVSSVAVTEDGTRVIPPFILVTNWRLMFAAYLALAGIFAVAIYRLARSMVRLDLHSISRVEGI